MKKKYIVRHAILGALQAELSKFDLVDKVDREDFQLTLSELETILKRPQKEVLNQIDYLLMQKEVDIIREEGGITVIILELGSAAYFDSKYPQEGHKVFWNSLFDVAKTISTIILLIFAVITFITGILRSQRTEDDIRQLKQEVEALKRNQLPKQVLVPKTQKSS